MCACVCVCVCAYVSVCVCVCRCLAFPEITPLTLLPSPQVVGEYAYVLEDTESEEVLEKVTQLLQRRLEETDTHCWVVTAITKLVAQLGHMPESVQSQIAIYLVSTNTDVQEVCMWGWGRGVCAWRGVICVGRGEVCVWEGRVSDLCGERGGVCVGGGGVRECV